MSLAAGKSDSTGKRVSAQFVFDGYGRHGTQRGHCFLLSCFFDRFVEFASGAWVGVELDTPTGLNNGSVRGKSYFRCRAGYGVFAEPQNVLPEGVVEAAGSGTFVCFGTQLIRMV